MKISVSDTKRWEIDSSSQKVFNYLKKTFGEEREKSICYYGYPTYNPDNSFEPSLVWVDKEYGLVIFKIYDYNCDQLQEINEDYWIINKNKVYSEINSFKDYIHLLNSDITRPRYNLNNIVKIKPFFLFPFLSKSKEELSSKIGGISLLYEDFESNLNNLLERVNLTDEQWKMLVSIIQRMDCLNKNLNIKIESLPQNIGEAIIKSNQGINVLDETQEDSALLIPRGGMRIRGIAGTGKTIILSWKAAYLHSKYPDKKILYTFSTKSLYNQIKRLISLFYKKYSREQPNWNNLQVLHAWGGAGKPGVYYNTCINNSLTPETMKGYNFTNNPFGVVCRKILDQPLKQEFDYILIDEAQDLPIEFFRLLEKVASAPKNIVIAYDELQNTENLEIPNFENLFGLDFMKKPKVQLLDDYDFILTKSYRNHQKVLHLALALGFGIYSGIIQIIDRPENWKAIGYEVYKGNLKPSEYIEIKRPEANSPINLENIYSKEEVINVSAFDNRIDEVKFVADKIKYLIEKENVRPEEIMVINLNSNIASDYTLLTSLLAEKGINSKSPGFDFEDPSAFFVQDHVTLSTTRRSKGNESPIVFVMGINRIYSFPENKVQTRLNRSFSFVAITRAKCWCYITGSGVNMNKFMEEYNYIKRDYPFYKFNFPSQKELEEIKQINYITKDERSKQEFFENIEAVRRLLKSKGKYIPEDLKKELERYLKGN